MNQRTAVGPGGFEQRASEGGGVVLCSPLLERAGIRHGFATRLGGVSEGTCASLNFGLKGGDHPENVRENLVRLGRTVGFDPGRCFRLKQVHGAEVVQVLGEEAPDQLLRREGDALVTGGRGVTVGVVTADCVPVLLADPGRGAVAAVHAGWRGLVAGVVEAAVRALEGRFGSRAQDLLAAVGPCIGSCCYEVGEEVAASFPATAVLRGRGPRPFLDLTGAAREQLSALGLPPVNVSCAGLCTRCRADLLFSFRRDGEASGHHLSVISLSE